MSLIVDIRKGLGPTSLHACFTAADAPLALLGASGSGKSVTLKCVAGILRPDEGHIELNGVTLFDSAGHIDLPPQQRRVGYLFQQYALFPHMTVEQNIAAALPDRARREKELPELLRRFRLEGVADRKPRTLSGGEQQRAALARLLASRPRCVLLDEPLSALDAPLRAQLELELQTALEDFSGPVVWVTHDRGEAWRNCGEVCVIHRGRTRPPRTKQDLFRAPRDLIEAQMGGVENVFEGVKTSNSVQLPQLGLTLRCGASPSEGADLAGFRAASLHPAAPGEENSFPCKIIRMIDDFDGFSILLLPKSSSPDAPPLRMNLPRPTFVPPTAASQSPQPLASQGFAVGQELWVALAPEDIFLFEKGDISL